MNPQNLKNFLLKYNMDKKSVYVTSVQLAIFSHIDIISINNITSTSEILFVTLPIINAQEFILTIF